jgi:hypothetical protein
VPDTALPVRAAEAWEHVERLPAGPLRDFVGLGLGAATERLLRPDGMSEAEYRARLPATPVDMLFVVRVLEELAAYPERFRDLLEPEPAP